ncbi:MAG: DNA primase large subunit PriL [Thermoplasmatales archaeon]|nr:MAG: DNA primase large subunit PriL [Thermoplasmatales archaeon]
MEELVTLSKYPFLNETKQYVKDNNLSVIELLDDPLYERARAIGVERLENAFKDRDVGNRSLVSESDCIMEILSYPIARMIAVCVDDNYFIRRYALGEAVHAYKNLINESTNFLLEIAQEFKFNIKYEEETNKIRIYFKDYLRNAPTHYKEWKMINRTMEKGFLHIKHKELARIIQEALRTRINSELDMRDCNKSVYDIFSSDIKRIQNTVITYRKKIQVEPIGKLDLKKLPPCMKHILSSIQAGENVPHMGRFALVSFLNSLKLKTNDILKLLSTAPDYEEEKSRYQVEHITGSISSTSYKPPGCEKMRTYGICPVDQIDNLCRKKRHPLSYYIAKWGEEKSKK